MTDESLKYVSSRSNQQRRESRRKSKRQTGSRRYSKSSTNNSMSNSMGQLNASDNDLFGGSNHSLMDASTPDFSSPGATRAGVSPAFYDAGNDGSGDFDGHNSNVFEYASKYVRTPPPTVPENEVDALLQTSKDADPNDPLAGFENFQDEFEDEMDEIEMHAMSNRGGGERRPSFINLAELEAKSKRRRRLRKYCAYLFLFLLVGGVAGGLAWQFAVKAGNGKAIQDVPEANKLLKLWCAEELDLGPGQSVTFPLQVPEDCKVACNKAECCWNPNSDYECSQETEQFCAGYKAPCEIMVHHITSDEVEPTHSPTHSVTKEEPVQEESSGSGSVTPVEVPTAPAILKTLCVPQGPDFTASQNCYEACSKGDCCWNTTSTVHCTASSKRSNCGPYQEFCAFFDEHPPQNLGDDGSSSSGGNDSDNTPANEDSGGSGEVNDPYHDPFPPAPSGLAVYCNPNEMEEISLHICQDKCEPASCCWNTHVGNCQSNVRPELCEPYVEACSILNDLVSYPDNNGANTATTEEEDNNEEDADDSTGNNNNIPPAPSDFETRCSRENIIGASNGGDVLITCEKDCLLVPCCWKPGVETCTDNPLCDSYAEHCAIFAGLFADSSGGNTGSGSSSSGNTGGSSGGSSVGGSSSNGVNIPAPPSDITSTCVPDKLKPSVDGGKAIYECEKMCLPAACCWKASNPINCDSSSDACAPYMEPCADNLVSALTALEQGSIAEAQGTQDTQAAREVSEACDNQQAIFIKVNCQDACRPGNCCFDDSLACSSSIDCSVYEPCGILYRRNLRH